MVWLHCPKCNTTEYTEIVAPQGRSHFCGTQVEEVEVGLDIRAELTIARHNIALIDRSLLEGRKAGLGKLFAKLLEKPLIALRKSEETYLERLGGCDIPSYPGDMKDIRERLPVRETNRFGLLISEFRYRPEDRFAKGGGRKGSH